ncbi:MAG: MGH1-like glycoside hydrolase domain-containing protein, partial [Bacillota bacterium]
GTGGAWPVSSDRMVWALAAWEIYKVTGDKQWLKQIYSIIKKSYQSDILTIYDKKTGLMNGESSFLDWREQSYPAWMDPKDIYLSKNLGTNAVHFQAYNILAQMARVLGEPSDEYLRIAERIKKAMNKYLWIDDKGYYGQYLYGREYFSLSPKSEALGEALTVLFDIAESHKQNQIVERTPIMDFGIPTIYPQIPNIPPYHNNSVWPFVESFWALASAKVNNVNSVKLAMASIYRAAALFLTNKENIVVSTGDHMGTEINSDRQLWSLAGNLALTYRLIYGMNFENNRLILKPFIPEEFNGERALTNFKYRNSILDITLEGYGNRIKSVTIDGKTVKDAVIPGNMKGKHNIVIRMANNTFENSSVNLVNDLIAPETPQLKFSDSLLRWDKTEGADRFALYRNGTKLFETKELSIKPNTSELFSQYQVLALSGNLTESFLSAPVNLYKRSNKEVIEAETINRYKANQYSGFTGDGYIKLSKDENKTINFTVTVPNSGGYSIDFRYSNGNGPINTDNKCAIRNLKIDGNFAGAVILPQRGDGSWTDWGYSNPVSATLTAGSHNLELYFDEINDNMNGTENSALLDHIRITEVRNNGK